jgi:hypothetical protein
MNLPDVNEAINRALEVAPNDAQDAMIYRNGILDYDAHDAYLVSLGYEYLDLPCKCGGSTDDGHLPHCGWGKPLVSQEHPKEADVLGRSASAVAERLQEGTATTSNQALATYHTSRGGNSDGLHVTQAASRESDRHSASFGLDETQKRNGCVAKTDMPRNDAVTAGESSASAGIHSSLDHFTNNITRYVDKKLGREPELAEVGQ